MNMFLTAFVTLFVITDPPGGVPIFLALTRTMSTRERHRAAWQAVALAGGVIVVFAIGGQRLLQYMRIDVPALQAAGGLLLLLVALELLTGKTSEPDGQATSNVALVPLGTPLLAGPGAIVATMLFVRQSHHVVDYLAVALAIALVLVIVWVMLRFSGVVVRLLRPAGIEVVSRISGLLLAAIAVQMIAGAVGAMVTAYLHSPH